MSKLTTINKAYKGLKLKYLPKLAVLAGLILTTASPFSVLIAKADSISQRPALFALADTASFLSTDITAADDSRVLTTNDGSSLTYKSNPFIATAVASNIQAAVNPATQNIRKQSSQTIQSQNIIDVKKNVTVTAYSSTVDQCDDSPFITANGTYVHDGIVAANWLPFGAKVRIPEYFGDKVFVVADRMAKRFSNNVDVWMNTRDEAIQFGARHLTIEILEN